jgi:hypothetical protein
MSNVNPPGPPNAASGSPGPFRPLYGGPIFNDSVWFRNQLQTKVTQLIGDKVDIKKFMAEDKGEDKKLDSVVGKDLAAAIRSMRTAIKELGGPIDPSQPIPGPTINGIQQPAVAMSSITPPPNLTPANIAILNAPIPTDNEVNEKIALKTQLTALMQSVRAESQEIGNSNAGFNINGKEKKEVQTALNHVAADLGKATGALPAAAPRVP